MKRISISFRAILPLLNTNEYINLSEENKKVREGGHGETLNLASL